MTITNCQKNKAFLSVVDARIKAEILANIAAHYEITADEVFAELIDEEAEHLLDYVTGPKRSAYSALMQAHGLGV